MSNNNLIEDFETIDNAMTLITHGDKEQLEYLLKRLTNASSDFAQLSCIRIAAKDFAKIVRKRLRDFK
jgi:hypothetical protein